jgi:hypothetical protein
VNVPREYNQRLQAVFPRLRVRWSDVRETWQLEEKIAYTRTVDPNRYPRAAVDSFRRFSDGYRLLEEWRPRRIPSVARLITGLRQGNAVRIMDELGLANSDQWEALLRYKEKQAAERRWQKDKERGREYAGEFYDSLAWLEGRTVVSAGVR